MATDSAGKDAGADGGVDDGVDDGVDTPSDPSPRTDDQFTDDHRTDDHRSDDAGLDRASLGESLGLLAEGSSDVVYLVRSDGVLEWVSPSVTRVLGWRQADLVGARPWFVVHGDDRERAAASLAGSVQTGRPPSSFELRIRTRDGGYRWMRATGHTVRIGQNVDGFVVGLHDIDDLVRSRGDDAAERVRHQATLHALLDPHLMLLPVRDDTGQVVDFVCEDANPAACEVLGRLRADVEGGRLSALLPAEPWSDFLALLVDAVESGRPLVLDGATHQRDPDHPERHYDLRAIRVGSSVSLTWRDVTEHHLAARDLERSERRFRLAMAHAGIGMCLVDRAGAFLAVNAALCAFLARSEEDLLASTWQELTYPEDLGTDLDLVRSVVAGEREGYRLAKRYVRADGSLAYGDLTVTAVRDETGGIDYFIAQVVDVGEQVRTRSALAQSEQLCRLAFESAPIGMAVLGLDRRFLQVNPALCDLLGRPAPWLLAHGLPDVVHPDDGRADLAMHNRVLSRAGDRATQEKRLLRADGRAVWVLHSVALLRDAAGEPLSFMAHFLDITAERPADAESRSLATGAGHTRRQG